MKHRRVLIKTNMQVCIASKTRSYEKCHKMKLYYKWPLFLANCKMFSPAQRSPSAELITLEHSSSFTSRAIKCEFHAINSPVYDPNFAFSVRRVFWVFRRVWCARPFSTACTHAKIYASDGRRGDTMNLIPVRMPALQIYYIESAPALFYYLHLRRAGNANPSARVHRPYARVWSVSAPGSMSPPWPSVSPAKTARRRVVFL
jgi:hypothetical protein